ncbi:hypothetical protein M885DRAFT_519292, partial [Pelagophyceae sp. CCMP2097]
MSVSTAAPCLASPVSSCTLVPVGRRSWRSSRGIEDSSGPPVHRRAGARALWTR